MRDNCAMQREKAVTANGAGWLGSFLCVQRWHTCTERQRQRERSVSGSNKREAVGEESDKTHQGDRRVTVVQGWRKVASKTFCRDDSFSSGQWQCCDWRGQFGAERRKFSWSRCIDTRVCPRITRKTCWLQIRKVLARNPMPRHMADKGENNSKPIKSTLRKTSLIKVAKMTKFKKHKIPKITILISM